VWTGTEVGPEAKWAFCGFSLPLPMALHRCWPGKGPTGGIADLQRLPAFFLSCAVGQFSL
jgi:hypothetical protein